MGDLKSEFQRQITTLDEAITAAVATNTQSKREFSTTVIDGLTAINQRIMELANDIRQLKDELAGLQNQVVGNNGQIENNNARLRELEEQNAQLTTQRDAAVAELDRLKKQYMTDTQDFQRRIDECEEQLRKLTEQMTTITTERDALRNELNGKGDLANEHATQLQNLSAAHEQQLRVQEEDCNRRLQELQAQIQPLRDEIVTKDAEIARLTLELANNSSELQRRIDELTAQNTSNEDRIRQIYEAAHGLEAENRELIALIIEATESIRTAIGRLAEFNDPASFDIAGRDRVLSEINTSIENIRTLINERGVANPLAQPAEAVIQPPAVGPPSNVVNFQGVQFNIADLLKQLKVKAKQVPIDRITGQPSKYALALEAIQNGTPPEQALADASVPVKNGKVMGGKTKRRKYKKQKGGFTYKNNAKRRSFTSSIKTTSTGSNFARGKSKKSSRR
jgi:DNA repair exonuclease SbcCD ATPase subunit